ncbi:xanthine dehydrogenase 2-like [Eucalyptus grandis]|uniref:xanthine dehydrogenase 2-like n=1 Tax=Eucalyptus grandis TaxID=71139 RepID=UPI00192EDA62|nr:xanthine dehydrogenase 2-like [Eucalyptus grandis]
MHVITVEGIGNRMHGLHPVQDDGVEIGAAVRLSDLLTVFRKVVTERAYHETSTCKAFIEQLKWFAGTQIKNVASVGRNICTASPISDLNWRTPCLISHPGKVSTS